MAPDQDALSDLQDTMDGLLEHDDEEEAPEDDSSEPDQDDEE